VRTALTPRPGTAHSFALPARTRSSRHGEELRATVPAYSAAVDDLVAYVSHTCAITAGTSHDRLAVGVEALLRWLSARPARARLLLLDGPSGAADVVQARAVAHRQFVELIVAGTPGSEPAMVAAGVSAIENLLAAHLLRGGIGTLSDLGPAVLQLVSALCPEPESRSRRPRPRRQSQPL
jgi:hypothetical protein